MDPSFTFKHSTDFSYSGQCDYSPNDRPEYEIGSVRSATRTKREIGRISVKIRGGRDRICSLSLSRLIGLLEIHGEKNIDKKKKKNSITSKLLAHYLSAYRNSPNARQPSILFLDGNYLFRGLIAA